MTFNRTVISEQYVLGHHKDLRALKKPKARRMDSSICWIIQDMALSNCNRPSEFMSRGSLLVGNSKQVELRKEEYKFRRL